MQFEPLFLIIVHWASSFTDKTILTKTVPVKLKIPGDKKITECKRRQRKSPESFDSGLSYMAQRTGLEPATPGVTGRYSNRLNYRCASVSQQLGG